MFRFSILEDRTLRADHPKHLLASSGMIARYPTWRRTTDGEDRKFGGSNRRQCLQSIRGLNSIVPHPTGRTDCPRIHVRKSGAEHEVNTSVCPATAAAQSTPVSLLWPIELPLHDRIRKTNFLTTLHDSSPEVPYARWWWFAATSKSIESSNARFVPSLVTRIWSNMAIMEVKSTEALHLK